MEREISVHQVVLDGLKRKNPLAAKQINGISKLEWISSSFQMDGGTLTTGEIKSILEGQYLADKPILDHLLIRNYDEALRTIYNSAVLNDKTDMALILKVHHLLTNNEVGGKNEGGSFRKNVPVLAHLEWAPIHPQEIGDEITKMLKSYYRLRKEMDPLMRGCFLHHEIIRIYPFEENTEAVARAVLNFELIAAGLPPIPFSMSQQEYTEFLRRYMKAQEIKPFYKATLQILKNRLNSLIAMAEKSPV